MWCNVCLISNDQLQNALVSIVKLKGSSLYVLESGSGNSDVGNLYASILVH